MAIRNIRELGEPCLRKICKPVKEVNLRTKILIGDMFDTMYEANGVGLAAPQVGILKRIFVVDCGDEEGKRYRQRGQHPGDLGPIGTHREDPAYRLPGQRRDQRV